MRLTLLSVGEHCRVRVTTLCEKLTPSAHAIPLWIVFPTTLESTAP
jgi:hypothetical protein